MADATDDILPLSVAFTHRELPALWFGANLGRIGAGMFVIRLDIVADINVLPSDPAERRRVLGLMRAFLTIAQDNVAAMEDAMIREAGSSCRS